MRLFTSMGCSRTSKPATSAVPRVGGRKQVRIRIVVVFPAPFLATEAHDPALLDFK